MPTAGSSSPAVLVLCPSRNRPEAAAAILATFNATKTLPSTRLIFLVDIDDPTRQEYPSPETYTIEPTGSYVGVLNAAAANPVILADATVIGMVGDDNRFRTRGWDAAILDALPTHTPGIVYPDDGLQHERLPTSWWVSRRIVDEFHLAEPTLHHYYPDNCWLDLGRATSSITYLPDVLIEHLHPLAGKATTDPIYERNESHVAHDRAAYRTWKLRVLPQQARRLKTLITASRPRRVLADWHHPTLYESLRILFEDRFGWELYSPLGVDWVQAGWKFEGGTPGWTTTDYLSHPQARQHPGDDHFTLPVAEYPSHPRKLVTVAQAKASSWDYVLCSVPVHQRPFAQLAQRLSARLIHQVGNARHSIDQSVPQIILASATLPRLVRSRKVIPYHQEFDAQMFGYSSPVSHAFGPRASSFMLRLDSTSGPYDWLEKEIDFRSYGGLSPSDSTYLTPASAVADAMAASDWIWHDKRIGDGYGHVIHNAASIGRPLIGHASHYTGLRAEPYWRDLETCIDLDRHPPERAVRLIRAITADPEWHAEMCRSIRSEFDKRVNFAKEAAAIREALLS